MINDILTIFAIRFKVVTPSKDSISLDFLSSQNQARKSPSTLTNSSCQTIITLQDPLFTKQISSKNENKTNNVHLDVKPSNQMDEMFHIVPPTDYRRNSHHLRPFDTHWGINTYSRSFDQSPDNLTKGKSRKTQSFDECDNDNLQTNNFNEINSFSQSYQKPETPVVRKQISVTSAISSKTSSSASSHQQTNHIKHIYINNYTPERVRSCSRLGKDKSSINSSFNSSSDTNNGIIRSSYDLNENSSNQGIRGSTCRRKCNSERSPIRKVFVKRVTSKSLESRNDSWNPSNSTEQKPDERTNIVLERRASRQAMYLQRQFSECPPVRILHTNYQNQCIRHKSVDISRYNNNRRQSKTYSYSKIVSEMDKNQISFNSEETMDRNIEPHSSIKGLVNISIDNSEHQFSNYQMAPDILRSTLCGTREFFGKANRNQYQMLDRSNSNLFPSDQLETSAAARRRQFSQERRKINTRESIRRDSKNSLSQSVLDECNSYFLDLMDDKKGKSMILDRFFNSQIITSDNNPLSQSKSRSKTHHKEEILNQLYTEDTRQIEVQELLPKSERQLFNKAVRSKSQYHDFPEVIGHHEKNYYESTTNTFMETDRNPSRQRRNLPVSSAFSKSIDRIIPTIIIPDINFQDNLY